MSDEQQKVIELIGAPTDVGAGERGGSMGPESLRVAGLPEAIRDLGFEVLDQGNLIGPLNPAESVVTSGVRHLSEVIAWCAEVREAYFESLQSGHFPILLGGDHSLAIGSITAAMQHAKTTGQKVAVLWLDAHADFNTPHSSPSGNIHGMPLATLFGMGHPDILDVMKNRETGPLSRVVQVGIRSVDSLEKIQLAKHDVHVFDMRMIDEYGMRQVMQKALDVVDEENMHLHVSFDVDFLDPAIAPGVATTVPGGPTYREAQLAMEMIFDSGLMKSLDIMELNPAFDEKNRTAKLVVELVESLLGRQILAGRAVH